MLIMVNVLNVQIIVLYVIKMNVLNVMIVISFHLETA